MIADILQELIWDFTDFYSCANCYLSYCMEYRNKNKICSGVVKNPNPDVPYDVIRLCIKQSGVPLQIYDYTPDEAQSMISVLSQSMADWMQSTDAYQIFRGIKKN